METTFPVTGANCNTIQKKKKRRNGTHEESIQKKKAITTGVYLAGTHNVRGRFDAFHGANGICCDVVVGSLSTVSFQESNRGFSSPGGVVDY